MDTRSADNIETPSQNQKVLDKNNSSKRKTIDNTKHATNLLLYVAITFLLLPQLISLLAEPHNGDSARLVRVDYGDDLTKNKVLNMTMGETRQLNLSIQIDKSLLISMIGPNLPDYVAIKFETKTIQPQFEILKLTKETLQFDRNQLNDSNYLMNVTMLVYADYLGRAQLHPAELLLSNKSSSFATELEDIGKKPIKIDLPADTDLLSIIVNHNRGFWDTLFIVTVSLLVIVIYLNLGSQIDLANMRQIIHRPRSILLGFLISTLTMPLVAFLIPQLFETRNFILYRVGFFIFACGPAALASTPWAELMGGDKELSMSLQLAATIAGSFLMPTLIYLMELALAQSDYELLKDHPLRVPYSRLIELLIILIASLSIGYYFIGRNPKLRKITAKIYKPLIFAMLLFIIITSSVIYWFVYRMFDWNLTLVSFCIIVTTSALSYLLALTSTCDHKHAITIAISSIYKNEGIAFTILAFAFEKPDNFVAYVPALTQIMITSLMFCLIRSVIQCGISIRARSARGRNSAGNTPELIVTPSSNEPARVSASTAAKEREEFIPVNVGDEDDSEAAAGDQSDESRVEVQGGGPDANAQQTRTEC